MLMTSLTAMPLMYIAANKGEQDIPRVEGGWMTLSTRVKYTLIPSNWLGFLLNVKVRNSEMDEMNQNNMKKCKKTMWSNVKLWIRKVENSPGLSGLTSRGGKSLRRSTAAPEDSRLGLMNLQIQPRDIGRANGAHLSTKLEAKEPKNPLTKNEYYRQMSSYKLPNQAEVFYFGIVWWPVLLTRGLFTWPKRRNEIWRGMQTPNLSVNRILLPKGSPDSCGITCWYVFPSIVCPFFSERIRPQ